MLTTGPFSSLDGLAHWPLGGAGCRGKAAEGLQERLRQDLEGLRQGSKGLLAGIRQAGLAQTGMKGLRKRELGGALRPSQLVAV